MKKNINPEYWPDYLQLAFIAIGRAMEGNRLHPDVLGRIPIGVGAILADHQVIIKHLSGEAAKPGGNRYEIDINGPRIFGGWSFRSGELEKLARASHAASASRVAS